MYYIIVLLSFLVAVIGKSQHYQYDINGIDTSSVQNWINTPSALFAASSDQLFKINGNEIQEINLNSLELIPTSIFEFDSLHYLVLKNPNSGDNIYQIVDNELVNIGDYQSLFPETLEAIFKKEDDLFIVYQVSNFENFSFFPSIEIVRYNLQSREFSHVLSVESENSIEVINIQFEDKVFYLNLIEDGEIFHRTFHTISGSYLIFNLSNPELYHQFLGLRDGRYIFSNQNKLALVYFNSINYFAEDYNLSRIDHTFFSQDSLFFFQNNPKQLINVESSTNILSLLPEHIKIDTVFKLNGLISLLATENGVTKQYKYLSGIWTIAYQFDSESNSAEIQNNSLSIFHSDRNTVDAITVYGNLVHSGSWNDSNIWTSGVAPGVDDTIIFDSWHSKESKLQIQVNSDVQVNQVYNLSDSIKITIQDLGSLNYQYLRSETPIQIFNNGSLIPRNFSSVIDSKIAYERLINHPTDYFSFYSPVTNSFNTNDVNQEAQIYKLEKGAGSSSSFYFPFSGDITPGEGFAANNISVFRTEGIPNQGVITVPVENNELEGGGSNNLIGNPFPAGISAQKFVQDNQDELKSAALYLWSQTTNNQDSDQENAKRNIIQVNAIGSNFYDRNLNLNNLIINSGQGFGVQTLSASGELVFQPSQSRKSEDDFYLQPHILPISEPFKLWATATNSKHEEVSILIGLYPRWEYLDEFWTQLEVKSDQIQLAVQHKGKYFSILALHDTIQRIPIIVNPNYSTFQMKGEKFLSYLYELVIDNKRFPLFSKVFLQNSSKVWIQKKQLFKKDESTQENQIAIISNDNLFLNNYSNQLMEVFMYSYSGQLLKQHNSTDIISEVKIPSGTGLIVIMINGIIEEVKKVFR